jgi:DNA-binding beta-propeller fold protein YncE
MARRRAALLCGLAALAGCGSSSSQPPPAGPARSPALRERPAGRVVAAQGVAPRPSVAVPVEEGRALARLDPRARVLAVGAMSAAAGVGPTQAVSDGHGLVFVVDTQGDGLLLFLTRPKLELHSRVFLPGRPYAIAIDRRRGRLWVTLTASNRVAEVTANGRPRLLRTLPAVRQPDAIAVDPRTSRVRVYGARPRAVQLL